MRILTLLSPRDLLPPCVAALDANMLLSRSDAPTSQATIIIPNQLGNYESWNFYEEFEGRAYNFALSIGLESVLELELEGGVDPFLTIR